MKASMSAALAVPAAASIAMAMASMRMTLPVSFAAIPGVEQIGEPVIAETGDLMNARRADQRGEPAIARRRAPNGDRAIGADMEAAIGIDAVQPAAHIRKRGAEAGQRIGLEINVAEFDQSSAGRAPQPAALPIDAGVTDRAFGVVPDRELRIHCRRFLIDRGSGYDTRCSGRSRCGEGGARIFGAAIAAHSDPQLEPTLHLHNKYT